MEDETFWLNIDPGIWSYNLFFSGLASEKYPKAPPPQMISIMPGEKHIYVNGIICAMTALCRSPKPTPWALGELGWPGWRS
jgi:hypothetical protein